jgi:orotate phosphoribosyltransferase
MTVTFQDDVLRAFEEAGAIKRGHFLLSSGLHSDEYWEKFEVLQWPRYTEPLCQHIAELFRGQDIQVVAGPTTGGVVLAYATARALDVRAAYAEERSDGPGRVFRRGRGIQPGERVLIVDDVLTTGGSVREVIAAVEQAGGIVAGICVLVDRSTAPVNLGYPWRALARVNVQSWPPAACPLCRTGVPLQKLGGT